jgi:TNF receptor-associated protein 1
VCGVGIIKKYSNFVGFGIKLNGERVNTVRPLWTLPKQSVSEEEHKQFYQFLAHSYDVPVYRLHFTSDAPFSIQSVFYVPEQHQEKYGMGRMDPGVSLFSRKVLVKPKMKALLPEWLRFMKGVVDCEDVSLHLSREHFQDSDLIKRLGNVVTGRILKLFQDEAAADPAKYNGKFWKEFGSFVKEGICTDAKWKDELGGLLRCESSGLSEGDVTSLDAYVKRMADQQNAIYYLCVPSRPFAESSPYYESFKQRGVEVLFLYTSMDDFVMQNLAEYAGKRILSIESAQLPNELSRPTSSSSDASSSSSSSSSTDGASSLEPSLDPQEVEELSKWMKTTLLDRVASVKETKRLVSSPAIIVDHESASFRRMMKFVDPSRAPKLPKQRLEINAAHPIITRLNLLRRRQPAFAKAVAEQVFDNALIAAGLMDDPRSMLARLNSILEAAARNSTTEPDNNPPPAAAAADTATPSSQGERA